jgi:hypothetical protein
MTTSRRRTCTVIRQRPATAPPPLEGVFLGVSHFWGYLKRTEIENPWNSRGFLVNFGSGPGEPIRSITYDILLLTYCAFPA